MSDESSRVRLSEPSGARTNGVHKKNCCRVSLETQTLAEQSDSCKSEARLAPNFANSSDGVDDAVDTRGVEDSAALTCPRPVQSQSRGCVEGASG